MATYDHSSIAIYGDWIALNEITPRYNLCTITSPRRKVLNLDLMHRQFAPTRKCSGMGMLGYSHTLFINTHIPAAQQKLYYRRTTTSQFSGTVFPSGVRTIKLCHMIGTKAEHYTVLQASLTDSGGNFEFEGWYPVDVALQYFYLVTGDDGRESKDFLLTQPVANEFQAGLDPSGAGHAAATYDTSENLRTLLVHDTFDGAEGVTINSHAPNVDLAGTGWLGSAGGVYTGEHMTPGDSNFTVYAPGIAYQYAQIETNESDVLIHAQLVFGETALSDVEHGIMLRYTDVNNYLYVCVRDAGQATMQLVLVDRLAGVEADLKMRPLPTATARTINQYYQMKVLAKGNKIWYELNLGDRVWSDYVYNVEQHIAATKHGVIIGGDEMFVDDFKVWTV